MGEKIEHGTRIVSDPDENGVKTITIYERTDDGKLKKITRKVKTVVKKVPVDAGVLTREKWPLSADRPDVPSGDNPVEYPRPVGVTSQTVVDKDEDYFFQDLPLTRRPERRRPLPGDEPTPTTQADEPPKEERRLYRPPGASGMMGSHAMEREMRTVRVSNLSEYVTEDDMRALFSYAGRVERCVVPRNEEGIPRGCAYITFSDISSAERAIEKFNNHGFDNTLIRVDWAKSKEELQAGNFGGRPRR